MIDTKLAVVISTYQRKDGKTPFYLKRALDCVFEQTYRNFKVFLIGDKYEDNDEIQLLVSEYNKDKLYFENLPYAKERDNYTSKWVLWSYGGVNAVNIGIEKAISEDFEFICHLDHDDWWLPNHLEEIIKCINITQSDWICTKSTYNNPFNTLPSINSDEEYIPFHPKSSCLIHSSVCMNFKKIPLRYRDIYDETQQMGLPADADLWERTREFIFQNNLKSYYINKLTCRHDEEGYERI